MYQFRSPEKYERIVGGDTIDISQAPYQVRAKYKPNKSRMRKIGPHAALVLWRTTAAKNLAEA